MWDLNRSGKGDLLIAIEMVAGRTGRQESIHLPVQIGAHVGILVFESVLVTSVMWVSKHDTEESAGALIELEHCFDQILSSGQGSLVQFSSPTVSGLVEFD